MIADTQHNIYRLVEDAFIQERLPRVQMPNWVGLGGEYSNTLQPAIHTAPISIFFECGEFLWQSLQGLDQLDQRKEIPNFL